MKTILITILMIFSITTSSFSNEENNSEKLNLFGFINIHGSLEVGCLSMSDGIGKKEDYSTTLAYNLNYLPYFTPEIYLTFGDIINIGGSIRSIFMVKSLNEYFPKLNKYTVFVELFLLDHIRIGFQHWCEHDSTVNFNEISNPGDKTTTVLNRYEEKIYLKIEF
jgi:hypothetical protein